MFVVQKFDISDFGQESFSNELGQVLERNGITEITGLDGTIFRELYKQAEIFFCSPYKTKIYLPQFNWGYAKWAAENGNCDREVFSIHYIPQKWPNDDLFPDFQGAVTTAYTTLENLAGKIEDALMIYLQKNEEISKYLGLNKPGLKVFRFSSIAECPTDSRLREHRDPLSAMLPAATQDGLEIHVQEQWISVAIGEGSVLFLPGKILQRYSDGRINAVCHRVANLPVERFDVNRYSALFAFP